ncbi:MAG TPA: right-handed parallel beta-helix repeat-containing protein, partial [Polyangiaceae bacterium]|nr:right-handed parallel beta-helix repeat-containing protein [Polyangiaceae bacterium]
MQKSLLSSVFTLGILSSSALASAATYYASPTGSGSTCSAAAPCSLGSGINKIAGGDTLLLADGTYSGASVPSYGFNVTKSGTPSAWTTIAAAPGALPVIVGAGPSNNTGLGTSASYVQFVGIVVQKFNTGFANGWTGTGHVNDSNGNVRFINCIADGNGKNGIAFQSATGVLVRECIVAHNGGQADYASSGVDLFGAAGTYADNMVERNVSFENADTADHSDGSGFIVDDVGTGATFINNLGFRNGGSCIRLTQSINTRIINNSCYADGLDTGAQNPASPGEIFFSSATTQQGVLMINNIAIATGSAQDKQAIFNAPSAGVSNNYTKNDGTISFWVDAAGTNPDFRLKATASDLIDKGTASNGATNDLGFDPKCLTKAVPSVVGVQSWYAYSIDYAYIRSLGGVAGCFKPAVRSGTPDIGAYEYSSSVGSGGMGGT